MKTTTKKLLFILILVFSVMAIIITAKQIYDIVSNDKIIDNYTDGIDIDENIPSAIYGTISNSYTIQLYEWDSAADSTELRDYLKYIGDENVEQEGIDFSVNFSDSPPISTGFSSLAGEDTISVTIKFNITEKVKIGKIYLCLKNQLQFFNRDKETYKYSLGTLTTSDAVYRRYEFDYNGEKEYTVQVEFSIMDWHQTFSSMGSLVLFYANYIPTITFFLEAEYINIETNSIRYGNSPFFAVESNELLQTTTTIDNKKLSQYIYEQITNEWSKGKETATLKCSIGEYYDESGNLVISTKNNDLPMTFNIRDLVIPYIPIARGGTEPMSIRTDGKAKIFQVTQVRPYFDGACWQEIMLQEANETQSESLPFIVNRAPVLTGFPFPYYVESVTVTSVSSANGGVTVSDVEVTMSSDHKDISVDVGGSSSSEVTINLLIKYSLYK